MKKLLMYGLLALGLAACGSKSTGTDAADGKAGVSSEETGATDANAGGNAGDMAEPNTMALASSDEDSWTESYTGTLNGKIEVALDLHGNGDVVRGTITYKSSGKPIVVLGTKGEDGTMFLREFQRDGLITGVLSGTSKNGKYVGTWSGNDKEFKMDLSTTNSKSTGNQWPYAAQGTFTGEYAYHYPEPEKGMAGAAGTVAIKQKGDQVTFSIDCVNGPPGYHQAFIDETDATIENNEIRYTMPDADCEFVIRFFQGFVMVEHIGEHYDCGFGMGAGIEGEYLKVR